ncbi:hypothetical protein HC864_03405 [Candidatus Gracilibacteria bacterium]|nr:hypothetical protein [Candidatus Gracilibacteria bacterium]
MYSFGGIMSLLAKTIDLGSFLSVTFPEKIDSLIILGQNKSKVIIKEHEEKYLKLVINQIWSDTASKMLQRVIRPKHLVQESEVFGNGLYLCDKNFFAFEDLTSEEIANNQMLSLAGYGHQIYSQLSSNTFEVFCPKESMLKVLAFDCDLEVNLELERLEGYNCNALLHLKSFDNQPFVRLTAPNQSIMYTPQKGVIIDDGKVDNINLEDYYSKIETTLFENFVSLSLDIDRYLCSKKIPWSSTKEKINYSVVDDSSNFSIAPKSSFQLDLLFLDQLLVDTSFKNKSVVLVQPQLDYKDYTSIEVVNDNCYPVFVKYGFDRGLGKVIIKDLVRKIDNVSRLDDRFIKPANSMNEVSIKIILKVPSPIRLLSNGDIVSFVELLEVLSIGSNLEIHKGVKSIRLINSGQLKIGGYCPKFRIFESSLNNSQISQKLIQNSAIRSTTKVDAKIIYENYKQNLLDCFLQESNLSLIA